MISKEQIEYLAALSRISLSEDEKEKLSMGLAGVLEYVKKLDAIDIGDVVPTAHAVPVVNDVREDSAEEEGAPAEVHERDILIDAFPEKEGDHLKIKEILS
jgi:aspartyl-tRNA(Asn)/glutamyl-tRNA(Gln) amidotransferase subunit C